MRSVELNERNIAYPGWRVALASAACLLVGFASLLVYTFGVFLKPVAAEFGWSRQAVSGAFGVAALAVAACSPLLGALLDRYPIRRIILPCLLIFGCAFASLAFLTNHLWHLYAVFAVMGIVGNGTAHLAYSRPISTWFRERRGMAFAFLMSGGAVGAMILPVMAQSLIRMVGWRNAFAILGAMVLIVGFPLAATVRSAPTFQQSQTDPKESSSPGKGLQSGTFWIIVTVLFFASLSQNGSITQMASLLTDRGVSPSSAALAVSVLGGAILAGRLLTGWLLDRYFAPRVAFCLLAVAASGTFILAGAHSSLMGYLGASCIGIGMGGEADITPYLVAKYFGLKSFSTLYGFTWTVYAIAGAIGPVIMGKAFDATGSYQTLLSILSILTLGAGALMLLLPKYPLAKSLTNANLASAALPDAR
jgi:MFS family permease